MAYSANQDDWRSFALLLIDVQRNFWPESIAQAFPQFEEKVTRLLSFCRAAGVVDSSSPCVQYTHLNP